MQVCIIASGFKYYCNVSKLKELIQEVDIESELYTKVNRLLTEIETSRSNFLRQYLLLEEEVLKDRQEKLLMELTYLCKETYDYLDYISIGDLLNDLLYYYRITFFSVNWMVYSDYPRDYG